MAQANVKLTVDATDATRALQGVQNKTQTLQKSFGGLQRVIASVGFTVLARQAIMTSANFEKLTVRLGLLTKANGTFRDSLEIVSEAQKTFGLSSTEALEGITDITARLQPLGVSLEDIKTTFFGFNTAAKLAGATTMEANNAFRQLAQALGSGRLQGDEFRSIAEQIPTILKPVADELGVTVGELKKFASEGKITSAVVIRALKKIETEGADSLEELLKNDPSQVFKNLGNEGENLSRALGDALMPVLLPVVRGLTEITKSITAFLNSGAGKATLIFTAIAVAIKKITVVAPILIGHVATLKSQFISTAVTSALASKGIVGVASASYVAAAGISKATLALHALKVAIAQTGIGLAIVALGFLVGAFLDNKKAAEEAAEATKEFNKQLGIIEDDGGEIAETIKKITEAQNKLANLRPNEKRGSVVQNLKDNIKTLEVRLKILKAEKERNELIRLDNKFNDITIDQMKKITKLESLIAGKTEDQITLEEKILEIKNEFNEEDAKQLIKLLKKEDSLKRQQKEAERLKEIFKRVGEEIESSIKDNLKDAITGAKTFGEAMTSVLNRIRDKIIEAQIDKIFDNFGENFATSAEGGDKKGVGGFLGGVLGGLFADGGRPPVGKASIVGERGPELFVPKVGGTIIPNSAITGGGDSIVNNISVSVDASGSAVSGSDATASELGQQIAIAIQSELINQKRAGGLLAS